MNRKRKSVQYRRKREGKTNYKKRLTLLLSKKPRLVVRNSLNNILAQIIEYDTEGDKVVLSAHSSELGKLGWKMGKGNLPSAYLVGVLVGKKAKAKGIKSAILDIGLIKSVNGSKNYAVLAGALEAGLDIPHDPGVLPKKERLTGKHIADFASVLKKDEQNYKKRFSRYLKDNINPETIVKECEETKKRILGAK